MQIEMWRECDSHHSLCDAYVLHSIEADEYIVRSVCSNVAKNILHIMFLLVCWHPGMDLGFV